MTRALLTILLTSVLIAGFFVAAEYHFAAIDAREAVTE
jgi:hypothetical protein